MAAKDGALASGAIWMDRSCTYHNTRKTDFTHECFRIFSFVITRQGVQRMTPCLISCKVTSLWNQVTWRWMHVQLHMWFTVRNHTQIHIILWQPVQEYTNDISIHQVEKKHGTFSTKWSLYIHHKLRIRLSSASSSFLSAEPMLLTYVCQVPGP